MDDLVIDQLEWLLSCNLQGNRLARHVLVLAGALADTKIPEHISGQLTLLSRQVLLQETFDALVGALNQFPKSLGRIKNESSIGAEADVQDLSGLIAQIEDTRRKLLDIESVNYGELIGWIVGQAKQNKLWGGRQRRR